MIRPIFGSVVALIVGFATAARSNDKWTEETCAQGLLGFKGPDDLRAKVVEYKDKVAAGDKSQETEDALIFYRDIEWYCLKR
jgi:hypothetical protein